MNFDGLNFCELLHRKAQDYMKKKEQTNIKH